MVNVKEKAPAVYGTTKLAKRSDTYDFISTEKILDTFRENDWVPHSASQRKVQKKNANLTNFTKHLISFRNHSLKSVNGIFPQINVLNSHDGSSKFVMMAGLYRLICENGLFVSDSEFESISIRHRFLNPEVISNAIKEIVDVVPQIVAKSDEMINTKMDDVQRIDLAQNVITGIWEDPNVRPFEPIQLLEARRVADQEKNLWSTYNTIQENLMKGGLIGRTSTNKKRKMRGVTNIEKTISINKLLWAEADNFLKAA